MNMQPDITEQGLSAAEVAQRVRLGQTNAVRERSSRSYADIARENIFTLFNLILTVLLVVVLIAGQPQDALFGLVMILNAAVGTIQEARAKRTLDRLTLLSTPRARVVRDGGEADVAPAEVVLDDVCVLRPGDQLVADGVVVDSRELEIDESLLTGEALPVPKAAGDQVLSGSFVTAGSGHCRATRVGADAYAHGLAAEARKFTLAHSELRAGVDSILRIVLWAMLPIGVITVAAQLARAAGWRSAAISTVAALSGMVPQGLVLLTSIAFAASVIVLGRRHVLVQELSAVEVLARVDVLCIDKTGTLTEPSIALDRIEPLLPAESLAEALGALAAAEHNATAQAIAERYPSPAEWVRAGGVAFSSARKWSGADFGAHGTWVLGAPAILLGAAHADVRSQAAALATAGERVLLLARTSEPLSPAGPPREIAPAALVLLAERVRSDAADTLRFFAGQGVAVKVLSGDDVATAAAVSRRVGLAVRLPTDARELPANDAELAALMDSSNVFGRVTPQGKRRMVTALQASGHVVAMTGDGVNDVLALKAADLGIAMGSGAGAARMVSQMVLLDGRFSTLPGVVAEGRRVIANMERVSNLFLTKTAWALLLALGTASLRVAYPLLPRHTTLIDSLTIGIPAFVLAFIPNATRYRPGFIRRVVRFALPTGLAAGAAVFGGYRIALAASIPIAQARTVATLSMTLVSFGVLAVLTRPLKGASLAIFVAMLASLGGVLALPIARDFFALTPLTPVGIAITAISATAGVALIVSIQAGIAQRLPE